MYSFISSLCLHKVVSIGKSFEQRDMLVAKIGLEQPFKKPSIFIEGGKDYR